MSQFTITVVERASVRCAGLKIRTTMEHAARDCPKLWTENFGPRMESFPADPRYPGESYGASVMVDSDTFDYWAVMPLSPDAVTPEDMDILEIPGGLYAKCCLESLADLAKVYDYIYLEWTPEQKKYTINMQAAALEHYTCDYCKDGRLTIFCPLLEK